MSRSIYLMKEKLFEIAKGCIELSLDLDTDVHLLQGDPEEVFQCYQKLFLRWLKEKSSGIRSLSFVKDGMEGETHVN